MRTADFIKCLSRKEIPLDSPYVCTPGGYSYTWGLDFDEGLKGRDEAIKAGMWAIVTKSWTRKLARWIGQRTVLEVMAGQGWLTKALVEAGVGVIATDDYSWSNNGHETIYPVEKLEAGRAAVRYSDRDILLICWPPYNTNDAAKAIKAWGPGKPIVYIGESQGGCNADDEFFELFRPIDRQPDIAIPSWPGIHDYLTVGEYVNHEELF